MEPNFGPTPGRIPTGVVGANGVDRNPAVAIPGGGTEMPISLPTNLSLDKNGQIVSNGPVVASPCSDGNHNMQADKTEQDFEAEKCSRCGMGRLVRPR